MTREVFLIVLIASTAVDAAVAITALRWLVTQTPVATGATVPTLLRIAASVVLVQIVKLPFLVWMGVNKWGVMHLVYLDLVIALPVVAAATLLMTRRTGASRAARGLAVAAVIGAPVMGIYASFIEPARLQVERVDVPLAPERRGSDGGPAPLRIGVLADIQSDRIGPWEHGAVDRLLAERPEVILVPGDLLQGWPGTFAAQREPLRALLARLEAPGGVYFVPGNCEAGVDVAALFAGLDIQILANRVVRTTVGGRRLAIGGLDDDGVSPHARAVIRRLEQTPGDDDIRLLVTHRPDAALVVAPGSRIDLVVAGHTHGGQVRVPWFGPPVTLSRVPRHVAGGGLHDLGGARIYVSRGLGRERGQAPCIRVLCPPEITILSLQ